MESIKFTCDLKSYFDFDKVNDDHYCNDKHITKHTKDDYTILKYKKKELNHGNCMSLGLFRSVIIKGTDENMSIKSVSPFKSIEIDVLYNYFNDTGPYKYSFHEFVEGTMVNLFFTGNVWEISTRSIIGGKGKFFKNSNGTFRTMFLECMNECDFEFDELNREYCYSFVIQHPENRIVKMVFEPTLYLCAVFKIKGTNVQSIDYQKDNILFGKVKYPDVYQFKTIEEASQFNSNRQHIDYENQGIVVEYGPYRSKLRNPRYEYVRKLRGNNPKPQFHYLTLRKSGQLTEFLRYFPEFDGEFQKYREMVHTFTHNLHKNYIDCFVRKHKPLQEFDYEYRPHMVELHKLYIEKVVGTGGNIDNNTVISYVNDLEPAKLMFALNFKHRST